MSNAFVSEAIGYEEEHGAQRPVLGARRRHADAVRPNHAVRSASPLRQACDREDAGMTLPPSTSSRP